MNGSEAMQYCKSHDNDNDTDECCMSGLCSYYIHIYTIKNIRFTCTKKLLIQKENLLRDYVVMDVDGHLFSF